MPASSKRCSCFDSFQSGVALVHEAQNRIVAVFSADVQLRQPQAMQFLQIIHAFPADITYAALHAQFAEAGEMAPQYGNIGFQLFRRQRKGI